MNDIAERSGISRATLYRDAALRALIRNKGDSPSHRPVDARDLARLDQERASLVRERTELRKEMRALKERLAQSESLVESLRRENTERMRAQRVVDPGDADTERTRTEAYAEGFSAGTRAAAQRGARGAQTGGLAIVAARLPRASILSARKSLARALHPDLFATDPAAALLATEILKQLNSLVG